MWSSTSRWDLCRNRNSKQREAGWVALKAEIVEDYKQVRASSRQFSQSEQCLLMLEGLVAELLHVKSCGALRVAMLDQACSCPRLALNPPQAERIIGERHWSDGTVK